MTQKRIVFITILSLFLISVFLPAKALGTPRGQLNRDYVPVQSTAPQDTPVSNPAPAPAPAPAPGGSGDSNTGSSGNSGSGTTTSTPTRSSRSGGYYVAPTSPAPAPAPAPAPTTPPPATLPPAPAAPSWMTANEAYAFNLLNETRIKNGIPPVQAHQGLTVQARLKALDLVENNYFAHTSPTYGSAANMVRQAGIPFSALGENLSKAGNVYQAHLQLEYSTEGHRQIMLNPNYNYVGIGVLPLKATPGIIMVQIFIKQ
ncbi:MAG: CAP domain-containing protein [Bacillota bacterium]